MSNFLTKFSDLIDFNLWIILSYEIILISSIILLASRTSDKVLKGLQGTAAVSIIGRAVYDAYKKWKGGSSRSSGNNSDNKMLI